MSAQTLSVVVPVYNEQECLPEFYGRLTAVLKRIRRPYEIVFVDDGSHDTSGLLLAELAKKDTAVKVLTLSRNFGHHPAVFAGLEFADGDLAVIVDADLQDPPELIPKLVSKYDQGYQLVFARRRSNPEGWFLSALKKVFRGLMRWMSNIDFPSNVGVFSLIDRRVRELLSSMPERERYLVAMQTYLGFNIGYVDYEREDRLRGRSKQNLGRLFRLGMNSLFSYSRLPLQFSMIAGFLCLLATMVAMVYILYSKIVLKIAIVGWASTMTAILGMGTMQLLSLWIIGEYIDRIFENSKGRPYFVVWRQVGQRGIPKAGDETVC